MGGGGGDGGWIIRKPRKGNECGFGVGLDPFVWRKCWFWWELSEGCGMLIKSERFIKLRFGCEELFI